MANEFVAKNGLISQGDTTVSGSLTITQGITGSLQGTASYATSASYVVGGGGGGGAAFPFTGDGSISGSLTITGSTATASPLHVLSGSTSLLYISRSGNVGIGTTTPGVTFVTNTSTTATNTTVETTRFQIGSTGTTAAGFGKKLTFYGKANNNNNQLYAFIEPNFRFITNDSAWGGSIKFYVVNNGTTTHVMSVDGNGGGTVTAQNNFAVAATSTFSNSVTITNSSALLLTGNSSNGRIRVGNSTVYRTTSGSANFTPAILFATTAGNDGSVTAGTLGWGFDENDSTGLSFLAANGAYLVARANITITNLNNATGSEAGDLSFSTKTGATAMSEKMRISGAGDVTITTGSITMPNRPAFRVKGTSSTDITATTTLSGSAASVDYNIGSYYTASSGVFTAPLAGLYSVYMNLRCGSVNAQQQAILYKNSTTSSLMWEAPGNTGVAHFGVSGILNLAANDTLRVTVAVGSIQFDGNDSWGAAYIG